MAKMLVHVRDDMLLAKPEVLEGSNSLEHNLL